MSVYYFQNITGKHITRHHWTYWVTQKICTEKPQTNLCRYGLLLYCNFRLLENHFHLW